MLRWSCLPRTWLMTPPWRPARTTCVSRSRPHDRPVMSGRTSPAALLMSLVLLMSGTPASAENGYPKRDSDYHSYPEMVAEIRLVQTAHPDIVRISPIGHSYQGRTIWVV